MFCTECGQSIADDAKFCAYCGKRRTVPAASAAASGPPPASSPEPPAVTSPAARPVRSTAEIMPIRMQRPPVPQPRVTEAGPVEPEPDEPVVPWPTEEAPPPPLFAQQPPVAPERPPVRPAAPAPPTYSAVPPAAAEAPGPDRYRSVPFADTQVMPETTSGKRKMSPVLIGAILVALIALAGIAWMVRSTMGGGSKAAAPVGITIYPTAAKIVAGKGADFAATVTGAPTSEVTWKVEEGEDAGQIQTRGAYSKGDEISLYCTYTAPKTPGTYHLVATSTADTSKSATAEITVAAK
jgi:zinc-ribbon domain/Immunoglobulin I-set domain